MNDPGFLVEVSIPFEIESVDVDKLASLASYASARKGEI
jgi:hypothetical protein